MGKPSPHLPLMCLLGSKVPGAGPASGGKGRNGGTRARRKPATPVGFAALCGPGEKTRTQDPVKIQGPLFQKGRDAWRHGFGVAQISQAVRELGFSNVQAPQAHVEEDDDEDEDEGDEDDDEEEEEPVVGPGVAHISQDVFLLSFRNVHVLHSQVVGALDGVDASGSFRSTSTSFV